MTSADSARDRPHPWSLNGAATLSAANPSPMRRTVHREEVTPATADRILLDEYRANYGRCDRCEEPWPCAVVREIRYGGAA